MYSGRAITSLLTVEETDTLPQVVCFSQLPMALSMGPI